MANTTGIAALIAQAEADEDSQMDPGGALGAALGSAIASLSEQYGADANFTPPGDQGGAYAKMFADVAKGFSSLFNELSSMRSSYLPFELAKEAVTTGGEIMTLEEIADSEAVIESYENAFFRMLGMPSSADINPSMPLVSVDYSGKFITEEESLTQDMYMVDLDIRQLPTASRPGAPTNAVYDFLSASISAFTRLEKAGFKPIKELQEIVGLMKRLYAAEGPSDQTLQDSSLLLATLGDSPFAAGAESEGYIKDMTEWFKAFDPSETDRDFTTMKAQLQPSLDYALNILEPNLSSRYTPDLLGALWSREIEGAPDPSAQGLTSATNFWKFSYLLFPPIQDGRVAKCVNEPKKMVAPPFLPKTHRVVNGHSIRSTLLEAVIRIRLDTLAGTTMSNVPDLTGAESAPVTVGISEVPITYGDIANSRGLIESLIVTRLFAALHGFALDVAERIKDLQKIQHKTGYSPSDGSTTTDEGSRTDSEKKDYCEDTNASEPGSRCQLETMKTIEESILLILGDDSTPSVLEVQEGQVRGSGLKSAHLMSAVLSVLDVPRQWVSKQMSTDDEEKERVAHKAGDETIDKISEKIGFSKGVGAVDLLAFIIAFFTVKEETLLSLLTEEQFSNLKTEFPSGFFDESLRRSTIGEAVNDVSRSAFNAYQLFRYAIDAPGNVFVFPVETEEGGGITS